MNRNKRPAAGNSWILNPSNPVRVRRYCRSRKPPIRPATAPGNRLRWKVKWVGRMKHFWLSPLHPASSRPLAHPRSAWNADPSLVSRDCRTLCTTVAHRRRLKCHLKMSNGSNHPHRRNLSVDSPDRMRPATTAESAIAPLAAISTLHGEPSTLPVWWEALIHSVFQFPGRCPLPLPLASPRVCASVLRASVIRLLGYYIWCGLH